jgi:hypothetical protein
MILDTNLCAYDDDGGIIIPDLDAKVEFTEVTSSQRMERFQVEDVYILSLRDDGSTEYIIPQNKWLYAQLKEDAEHRLMPWGCDFQRAMEQVWDEAA